MLISNLIFQRVLIATRLLYDIIKAIMGRYPAFLILFATNL